MSSPANLAAIVQQKKSANFSFNAIGTVAALVTFTTVGAAFDHLYPAIGAALTVAFLVVALIEGAKYAMASIAYELQYPAQPSWATTRVSLVLTDYQPFSRLRDKAFFRLVICGAISAWVLGFTVGVGTGKPMLGSGAVLAVGLLLLSLVHGIKYAIAHFAQQLRAPSTAPLNPNLL